MYSRHWFDVKLCVPIRLFWELLICTTDKTDKICMGTVNNAIFIQYIYISLNIFFHRYN